MIIATDTAAYKLQDDRSQPTLLLNKLKIRRVIEGLNVNIVALSDGRIVLIKGTEQWHLDTGIKDRLDSLCILREDPLELLIGTTPPFLYRMTDEGPAKRITSFDNLEVRSQWYTPWGGPAAVRSLAKTMDGWVYADIHVGSIMRSPDGGEIWEPVTPTLHADVHEVVTTPASNNRVYANTYLSVYVSDDRGSTWNHRSNDLRNRYGRGIAVHPEDAGLLLCGVSDGPTGINVHGQLFYTEDAGHNWVHVTKGFPASTHKNIDTFHIAYVGNTAWVTEENKLFYSPNRGKTWQLYWTAPTEIIMIASYPL